MNEMYEPSIIVRGPREDDLESLLKLLERYYMFNEEFDPALEMATDFREKAMDVLRRRIAGEGLTLLAEQDGRIVGYLYAVIEEDKLLNRGKICIIRELYVSPESRETGVASRLISELIRMLDRMDVRHIAAVFPTENYVAESLYDKLGFRRHMYIYLREVE